MRCSKRNEHTLLEVMKYFLLNGCTILLLLFFKRYTVFFASGHFVLKKYFQMNRARITKKRKIHFYDFLKKKKQSRMLQKKTCVMKRVEEEKVTGNKKN